jgi:toxin ParE1/3/4
MSSYVLSNAADTDLINIFEESVVRWGIDRASRYLMELHGAFELISKFPNLGIDAGRLRPGYFRFTRESHAVYFQKTDNGVFIVRVLHQKQSPENQLW